MWIALVLALAAAAVVVVAGVVGAVVVGGGRAWRVTLAAVGRALLSLLDDFALWGQWSPYAACARRPAAAGSRSRRPAGRCHHRRL